MAPFRCTAAFGQEDTLDGAGFDELCDRFLNAAIS
jgi:hypothetical protein